MAILLLLPTFALANEQQLQDVSVRSSCDAERSFYQKLYSDALAMKNQAQNLMALSNKMRSAWDDYDEALYKSYSAPYNTGLNQLSASIETFNSFSNQSATLAKCHNALKIDTACDHVYIGMDIRTKGVFGLGLIVWEVVGINSRTERVNLRDRNYVNGYRATRQRVS